MATQIKHRRGTTSEIATFTPAVGEIVMDTDTQELVLGDGITVGGIRIQKKINRDSAQTALADTKLKVNDYVITRGRRSINDRGAAEYIVVPGGTATHDGGLYINMTNGNQLMLIYGNVLNSDLFGLSDGDDVTYFIETALSLVDNVDVYCNGLLSNPVDIPSGKQVDFHGNDIDKAVGFTSNSDDSYFKHVGNRGKILNVNSPNIGADERLISYLPGVDQCIEEGCSTGRGNANLIKFQSVRNNNVSRTLESEALSGNVSQVKTIKVKVESSGSGVNDFKRVRYFPSYANIQSIKVTDTSGSPDFYFELAMREGVGFAYPYTRARDTSDIDVNVNIDWIYDSSDDILSFSIVDYNVGTSTFEVEITYTNSFFASLSSVWAWQSDLDFLRPHNFGSSSRAEAIRSPEYRSHITGTGLDVRVAVTDRNPDANYNLPNVTMPNPGGTQDLTESSELKFYFRLGAAEALGAGVTHALFRLYQSNTQIKCTVINGFLAQAPDWVPEDHLAVSFQDDIEIDWAAHTDRDNPIELLIPLDPKMMQRASAQAEQNDFNYYYLTFFANLPEHVPIEWGDVWEWDFQFIRK